MGVILDIAGDPIEREWAAEFRGFFAGEGYLGIVSNGKPRYGRPLSLVARAQITSRSDEYAALAEIHRRLGGVLGRGKSPGASNPVTVWRVSSRDGVSRVCDLLSDGWIAFRKREMVYIVRQFLGISGARGEAARAERLRLHRASREAHEFRP